MSLRIAYLAGRPYLVAVGDGVMYPLPREEIQSPELTDKFGRPLTDPSREPFPAPVYGITEVPLDNLFMEPTVIRAPERTKRSLRKSR